MPSFLVINFGQSLTELSRYSDKNKNANFLKMVFFLCYLNNFHILLNSVQLVHNFGFRSIVFKKKKKNFHLFFSHKASFMARAQNIKLTS